MLCILSKRAISGEQVTNLESPKEEKEVQISRSESQTEHKQLYNIIAAAIF